MNEHPGAKPTVIQPQTPAGEPVRSLRRGLTDMPVGLAANSVGLGSGQGLNLRRILFIVLPITVVIALCIGVSVLLHSLAPLTTKTMANGVYVYSFLFYRNAEPANLLAGQGFNYQGKALAIAKISSDGVPKQCSDMDTRKTHWQEAFRAEVAGVDRPVCRLNGTVYMVTFYQGKAAHLLQISYATSSDANNNDVRKIVESVKATLE